MRTILNFLGFSKKEIKKIHSYKKATTNEGSYYKREDGLEFYVSDFMTA